MTFLRLSCRAVVACLLIAAASTPALCDDAAATAWAGVHYRPGSSVRIDQGTRCEPKRPTCSLYLAIHLVGRATIRCDLLDQGRRLRIFDKAVELRQGGVNFQTAEFVQRPLGPKEYFHTPDVRCRSSQAIWEESNNLPNSTTSIVPEQWRFRDGKVEGISVRKVTRPWHANRPLHFRVGWTTQVRCGFYRSGALVRVAETAIVDGEGTGDFVGTMTLDPPISQVTGIECAEGNFESGT